jgi:hypothetical protein
VSLIAVATLVTGAQVLRADDGARPRNPAVKSNWNPPVLYVPITKVEPPRNVPASSWLSPYCTKWNDGCEECERKDATDKPQCRRLAIADRAACHSRTITCSRVDQNAFDRICALEYYYTLDLGTQNRLLAGEAVTVSTKSGQSNYWMLADVDKNKYELMWEGVIAPPRTITLESERGRLPGMEFGRATF